MEYITSDLHYFHNNIIKYCDRPFSIDNSGVAKMNEFLMEKIEELPDEEDTILWNLGDVFFGKALKEITEETLFYMVGRMKGQHRKLKLILGNHDKQIFRNIKSNGRTLEQFFRDIGFDSVYYYPVIIDEKFVLSHEPIYLDKFSNLYNIYGHLHDTKVTPDYFKYNYENYAMELRVYKEQGIEPPEPKIVYPDKVIDINKYINVCWDANNKILNFTELKEKLK